MEAEEVQTGRGLSSFGTWRTDTHSPVKIITPRESGEDPTEAGEVGFLSTIVVGERPQCN
jgi:hypothetical protein